MSAGYDWVAWLTPRHNVTKTHVTVRGVTFYREPNIGVYPYRPCGDHFEAYQIVLTPYDAKRFGLEPIR